MTAQTQKNEVQISLFKNVNVVGTSGVGKSTFARKLAEILGSPYIEMDKLFWGPNWYWPSDEAFFSKLKQALSSERWVLDGNYTRSTSIKWESVQIVIWLDYPFYLTLYQAMKRAFVRSLTQEELWEGTGNKENFRKSFFSKNSIIMWTIKTYKNNRLKYEAAMQNPQYSQINFIRLKSHKEAAQFLKQLQDQKIGTP